MEHTYYPDLYTRKPCCQIEARIALYPRNHYRLFTHLDLSGQGIRFDGNVNADPNDKKIYIVTPRAYKRIAEKYSVLWKCYLD